MRRHLCGRPRIGLLAVQRDQTLSRSRPAPVSEQRRLRVVGGTVSAVDRVVVDPAIMGGVPCIAGTRIPVVTILGFLGEDMPITELLAFYPQLTRDDVLASLRYAAAVLDGPGA